MIIDLLLVGLSDPILIPNQTKVLEVDNGHEITYEICFFNIQRRNKFVYVCLTLANFLFNMEVDDRGVTGKDIIYLLKQ